MKPTIDVVVIGLNSAKTLAACLSSVRNSQYPAERISIYYADGGSTDDSRAIAESFGASFLLVEADAPTPGRQRNAGWRAGSGELVQFLDSDTVMDPQWLALASSHLVDEVAAVCGNRREFYPERSVFNWIGDQEWNAKPGLVGAFGGDVLIRRSALAQTGGYRDGLIAGEDPELSHRVCQSGGQILKLDAPMTQHDLAMLKVRQYWKRSYRTGHAYAEVHALHPDFWGRESRRILVKGSALEAAIIAAAVSPWLVWALIPAALSALFFLRPRWQLVGRFQADLNCSRRQARIYAWHATLVVVPQFFGMLRFYFGYAFRRPLTNNTVLRRTRGR